MPIGLNATILEYEASWLYTAGLYSKAVDRLERTIQLSDNRIRPFQILGASYANLDDYSKAKETEDRCISIILTSHEKKCRLGRKKKRIPPKS
jgi:tetratricopeptide (TPR) repeat protein